MVTLLRNPIASLVLSHQATVTRGSPIGSMATPAYSRRHVDNCAFASWYPRLRHASIKGEVVPLPPAFVSFLLSDGVSLPATDAGHEADGDADDADDHTAAATAQAVSEVRAQVQRVLAAFGGKAFVKTNWSAPRDASWMLGSLQCVSVDDVLLLLQASDFVVHDLTRPYAGCVDAEDINSGEPSEGDALKASGRPAETYLVLKKWCNLFDSMLFRCFVAGRALVGVSQRYCGEFYDFLLDRQDFLCERIFDFFEAHLKSEDAFPDPDFVFDVYVDKRHRVFLLDMNVFGAVTEPLLFSWDELEQLRAARHKQQQDGEQDEVEEVVDFRVVESKQGIRANPLSGYRAPTDLVDHLAGGAGFEAFLEQVQLDNAALDGDSSDEE